MSKESAGAPTGTGPELSMDVVLVGAALALGAVSGAVAALTY